VIGIVGGVTYVLAVKVEQLLKIDDPLDAWPVHGACGVWGMFAVGVFARPEYSYNQQGRSGFLYAAYAGDPNPSLMLPQFLFVAAHTAWVGSVAVVLFGALRLAGLLRVSAEVEELGMDLSKHGGEAYYDVIARKRAADFIVVSSRNRDAGKDVETAKGGETSGGPAAGATDAKVVKSARAPMWGTKAGKAKPKQDVEAAEGGAADGEPKPVKLARAPLWGAKKKAKASTTDATPADANDVDIAERDGVKSSPTASATDAAKPEDKRSGSARGRKTSDVGPDQSPHFGAVRVGPYVAEVEDLSDVEPDPEMRSPSMSGTGKPKPARPGEPKPAGDEPDDLYTS
jgi:hypothetical protein